MTRRRFNQLLFGFDVSTRKGVAIVVAAIVLVVGIAAWPYTPSIDHCKSAVIDAYHEHKDDLQNAHFSDMRCEFLSQSQQEEAGREAMAELWPEILRDAWRHAFTSAS